MKMEKEDAVTGGGWDRPDVGRVTAGERNHGVEHFLSRDSKVGKGGVRARPAPGSE